MNGLDSIGFLIVSLHQSIGHDKTAVVIGMPAGDKSACLICAYMRQPDDLTRQAVIRALAHERSAE